MGTVNNGGTEQQGTAELSLGTNKQIHCKLTHMSDSLYEFEALVVSGFQGLVAPKARSLGQSAFQNRLLSFCLKAVLSHCDALTVW